MKLTSVSKHFAGLAAISACFCVSLVSVVNAQPSQDLVTVARLLEGTTYVLPMNQFIEGKTHGCGFEFKALTLDSAYKKGYPVAVNGSFSIMRLRANAIGVTYKLGTFLMNEKGDLSPEAPNFAWFRLGSTLIRPSETMDGENRGYKLYLSPLSSEGVAGLQAIVDQGPVSVGFNRTSGGFDVVVDLDLSVRDTQFERGKVVRARDNKLGESFASCMRTLVQELSAQ